MKTARAMSDARLLELGLLDEYCSRFASKDFVVYDTTRREYVWMYDSYDQGVDWTPEPKSARIFHGADWAAFWAARHRRFILPEHLPELT